MKVNMKNSVGVIKKVKVGFSWTTFFFGGFVAMFRGQWGEVAKWFFLSNYSIHMGICSMLDYKQKDYYLPY